MKNTKRVPTKKMVKLNNVIELLLAAPSGKYMYIKAEMSPIRKEKMMKSFALIENANPLRIFKDLMCFFIIFMFVFLFIVPFSYS